MLNLKLILAAIAIAVASAASTVVVVRDVEQCRAEDSNAKYQESRRDDYAQAREAMKHPAVISDPTKWGN